MDHSKKTKIVATVGPASNTKEMLMKLAKAGANVFRLNFSHGTHEQHAQVMKYIREINTEQNCNIAMLQDLQGPKIRTDEVENNGVDLVQGAKIVIQKEKILGTKDRISSSYALLTQDLNVGEAVMIDDGNIELKVISKAKDEVTCEVIYGGKLKSKKGINLPNTIVSEPSLTVKDREDLAFGIENDFDWIALSFVRSAADIIEMKDIIKKTGKDIKVIAKIEKPEAIDNIDAIIEESDGLMVARGDLGVEVLGEEVPLIQKMIIRKCNAVCKPVIVATQMLESMVTNARPTRAETNDVANAIIDGADAVMLSAESASGNYPVKSVESMARICRAIEKDSDEIYIKNPEDDTSTYSDSVIDAACILANQIQSKAIIGLTKSGYTAYRLSGNRPKSEIFVFTNNKPLLLRLSLVWGIKAFFYDQFSGTDETIEGVKSILVNNNFLQKGDLFITTACMPYTKKQHADMLKLSVV